MATRKTTTKSKSRSTTKARTSKTKATSKTQRAGRKTATPTSKGTKTSTPKKTTVKKTTVKKTTVKKTTVKKTTTKKPTTTTSKTKTPASPELPGGMAALTTKAPPVRVYSASVGFRSKVWGLLYGQRSNGGKVEVCVQDGMTMPEATKARTLMANQDSIEWVRVIATPTEKQMRG